VQTLVCPYNSLKGGGAHPLAATMLAVTLYLTAAALAEASLAN